MKRLTNRPCAVGTRFGTTGAISCWRRSGRGKSKSGGRDGSARGASGKNAAGNEGNASDRARGNTTGGVRHHHHHHRQDAIANGASADTAAETGTTMTIGCPAALNRSKRVVTILHTSTARPDQARREPRRAIRASAAPGTRAEAADGVESAERASPLLL